MTVCSQLSLQRVSRVGDAQYWNRRQPGNSIICRLQGEINISEEENDKYEEGSVKELYCCQRKYVFIIIRTKYVLVITKTKGQLCVEYKPTGMQKCLTNRMKKDKIDPNSKNS